MTRRQQAIKEAIQKLNGQGVNVWITVLSDLIDQAEAGKLRETTPTKVDYNPMVYSDYKFS